jgi:hypothetical protein
LTAGGCLYCRPGDFSALRHQSAAILDEDEDPEIRAAVSRQTDARAINVILNHPKVRPFIDSRDGTINAAPVVENPDNFALAGAFGTCIFLGVMPGVFEVHSACLPEGRGAWMKAFAEASLQWMFTRTNAWEITTRVPHGHVPAKALTEACGFRLEFTRPECVFLKENVPVDIYRLDIMDWAERSQWALESGHAFHDQLHAEAKRLGIIAPAHEDDPQHNRVAGAAVEMVRNGQIVKAVLWYNRWAYMARHAQIGLVSEAPPVVRMDIGDLHILPKGIEVRPC